jgi:Activator of Hsp90 ATPase homolog 1-like protein
MQEKVEGTTTATSFTTSFTVDRGPDVAYEAINNVRGWWSGDNEGSSDTLGGVFTHRYEEMHCCKIKVVELVPNRKVAWLVLDNYFDFIEDRNEWKGTKIIFDIAEKGGKTEVRFTHEGLVPEYECFNVCSNAWGSIINGDLRSLITLGKGSPNPKMDRKSS